MRTKHQHKTLIRSLLIKDAGRNLKASRSRKQEVGAGSRKWEQEVVLAFPDPHRSMHMNKIDTFIGFAFQSQR